MHEVNEHDSISFSDSDDDRPSKKLKLDDSIELDATRFENGKSIIEYILDLYKNENIHAKIINIFQTLDLGQSIDLEQIHDEQLQFLLVSLFSKDQAIAKKNWSHHVHQSRNEKHTLKFKKKTKSTKNFFDCFQQLVNKNEQPQKVQMGPTDEELALWHSQFTFEQKNDSVKKLEKLVKQGYMYDEASGYYYNHDQALYYDPTTEYFYDTVSGCWMYEEENKLIPVTTEATTKRQTYVPPEHVDDQKQISKEFTPSTKLISAMKKIDRKEKRTQQPKRQKPLSQKMRAPSPEPENVGNKLLKKLGWNEGEGLGKNKSGITAPIEAQVRLDRTGIGHSTVTYTPQEYGSIARKGNYQEAVRRSAIERFKSLK
jgi:hypothetical protein